MMLIVFFSSRISPFTSTVIFLDRSPRATAVVTSAMFRTWPVRLLAIRFTLSVRSFQVPATPSTCAWPPSLPSVPTSRATRVTSDANEPSWSTIVFTVLPIRRNSPSKGFPSNANAMRCDRSPLATAPMTRDISTTGCTRSLMSELTEPMRRTHPSVAPVSEARSVIRPSLPTTRVTRSSSAVDSSKYSTKPLNASATSPGKPLWSSGSRVMKSPLRTRRSASRTCSPSISVPLLTSFFGMVEPHKVADLRKQRRRLAGAVSRRRAWRRESDGLGFR